VGFTSKAQRVGALLFRARSLQVTDVHTQNKAVQPQSNEAIDMDDNNCVLSTMLSGVARCLETVKGETIEEEFIKASRNDIQFLSRNLECLNAVLQYLEYHTNSRILPVVHYRTKKQQYWYYGAVQKTGYMGYLLHPGYTIRPSTKEHHLNTSKHTTTFHSSSTKLSHFHYMT
jgi:hypothetical protein